MIDESNVLVQLAEKLPPIPKKLLLARDRGEVLFIVGSGISCSPPSNLGNFQTLVKYVYIELDKTMLEPLNDLNSLSLDEAFSKNKNLTSSQKAELKYINNGEYDVVLGMLERRIDGSSKNSSRLREIVNKCFYPSKKDVDPAKPHNNTPNDNHKALVTLAQRYGETLIVTTNFDRLLHIAARNKKLSCESTALGAIPKPTRRNSFTGLLHIHGMVGLGKQKGTDLILTDHDFGDWYLRRHEVTNFIYDAARIFNIVLVGYSANDPPMRYLLNAIAGDDLHYSDIKERFAIVACDDEEVGLLKAEWEQRGITPIIYDNSDGHVELTRLLNEWARSISTSEREKWSKSKLRKIITESDANEAVSISLFRYIFERETDQEKVKLAKYIGQKGASPKWLTIINELIRSQ